MKVQGNIPRGHEAPDPELEALALQLDAVYAELDSAVRAVVSAPVVRAGAPRRKDAYVGAQPKSHMADEVSASSVAPRERAGAGVPLHQLLASVAALGPLATADDTLFAWDAKADTSIDEISTRKLLQHYESSMAALHGSLKTMDHDRKEGLWYERYREDLWRELDADGDYYRAQSDYADRMHYDDMYADRLAAEAAFSQASYYDYDDQYR